MNKLVDKFNSLPKDTKVNIATTAVSIALSVVARKSMYKTGMVKSFWYGLPHKPNTFR